MVYANPIGLNNRKGLNTFLKKFLANVDSSPQEGNAYRNI